MELDQTLEPPARPELARGTRPRNPLIALVVGVAAIASPFFAPHVAVVLIVLLILAHVG